MTGQPRRVRRCKKCDAPIRFLLMDNGKWLPVDARPSALRGKILIVDGARGKLFSTGEARRMRNVEGHDLYVSHWDGCPGSRTTRADGARDLWDRERAAARRVARTAFSASRKRRDANRQERLFR